MWLYALPVILCLVVVVKYFKCKKDDLEKELEIEETRPSIIIKQLSCGHMEFIGTPLGAFETQPPGADCAGGVDVKVVFKNNTYKTIKYVSFVFNAYNAVDDRVKCTIKDSYESTGLFTGPLLPGHTSESPLTFRGVFYNSSIDRVVVKSALVTYKDDTSEEVTRFR